MALCCSAVLALISTTFTNPEERAKAFAIYGAVAGAGGALGLLLGGVLTSYASWRWTLLVNLFFAAVGVAGAISLLRRDRGVDHDPPDWPGVLSATGGLFALVFGFNHAETTSWLNHYTLGSFVVGALLLGAFASVQRRTRFPPLSLRVVLDRNRGGALAAMIIASSGMFGVFFFLTYYLQTTLGFSAVMTGFAFMPMVAGTVVTAQLSNIVLLPRVGPRPLIPLGLLVAASAVWWLTQLNLASTYSSGVFLPLIVMGLGIGLVFAPGFSVATFGVAEHDAGVASALVNTSQQIGGSVGTALLNTLAASAASAYLVGRAPTSMNQALAAVHSYTTVFSDVALIFVGGAILTAAILRSGPTRAAAPLALH